MTGATPWHRRAGRLSLAAQLTAAMLLVATAAMAGLFYELSRANRVEIEQLQSAALSNSAGDLARSLDALIQDEISQVADLALSRSAQEFIAARPTRRAALFTPTLADFGNFLDSNAPFFRAVLLLDTRGEVLLATDGSYVGLRFPSSAFVRAAAQGQTYMSDPGISALDRRPVIWLSAPIRGPGAPDDAPLAGLVAVAISPEELWQAVEQVQIGAHGYAMLVDRYGIRLAHGRDRSYIFRSLAPLPDAVWAGLQAEGRFAHLPQIVDTGNPDLLDFVRADPPQRLLVAAPGADVPRVYYSAARLKSRDWTVVTMISEREVLAPTASVTLRGMVVTILVVVALGLTVAWTATRLVRPLPQLATAAQRIAGGDLSVPVAIAGSSEVRTLARDFETMRGRLGQAHQELADWAATLERRVSQRSRELAALSEVVALSGSGQPQQTLLQTALERALPVMGAEMGGIWLGQPDGGLRIAAWSGFDCELQEALAAFAPGEGLLGRVHETSAPIALADISQSPRLARAVVREEGLHAFAAVPLPAGGRTLGVLGIFSHVQGGFSPEAVALMTSIGQQVALVLENSDLLRRVEAQARSVAALQERERIADEIHDGIAQNLSYLFLQLDQLADSVGQAPPEALRERLGRLQGVLEATTGEVRGLIARLQEVPAAPMSLGRELREEAGRLADELGLGVRLAVAPGADLAVDAATAAEVGRIVGEALRNAARHGHASEAQVALTRQGGAIHLTISDDGAGFDPTQTVQDGRKHFGLKVMEARARRIGGHLSIESAPGQGARVELAWKDEG